MADLDDIKDGKDFHTDKPQTNTLFALKAVARWIGNAVQTGEDF